MAVVLPWLRNEGGRRRRVAPYRGRRRWEEGQRGGRGVAEEDVCGADSCGWKRQRRREVMAGGPCWRRQRY